MDYLPLYTLPEAIRIVGTRTRVYDLIAAGRLVAVKQGRRTAVTGESMREYVEALPLAHIRGNRAAEVNADLKCNAS